MFWQSIAQGIGILFSHWEIWVAILAYGILMLLYMLAFGAFMMKTAERSGAQMIGCLGNLIAAPVVQGVLVAFMVTALLPILLGGHDFVPLSFLAEGWWTITKAGLLSMLITIGLGFIPVLGKIITDTPGTAIFVQGAIVVRILSRPFLKELLTMLDSKVDVFPGFWVSAGFVVLSILIIFGFTFGFIYLLTKVGLIGEDGAEGIGAMIGTVIGVIPGVLMLCIYCSYVTLSLKGLIAGSTL